MRITADSFILLNGRGVHIFRPNAILQRSEHCLFCRAPFRLPAMASASSVNSQQSSAFESSEVPSELEKEKTEVERIAPSGSHGHHHRAGEDGELPNIETEMMAKIGTCLGSMEAQMGNTNRLLESLVKEMKGMREELKACSAKEVQVSTVKFDKLLIEQIRTNDLIEKALYAEPSANLFATSKERHPHKTYLRLLAEDLEAVKRKLRQ